MAWAKAGMVDLLGMFRRRPAKRGKVGFARSREDITALGDSFGNMLTSPVRDAPPIAREAPMSGLDLLKAVRADARFRHLPFIMITAANKTENVVAAKEAGVDNYVVKPFTADTLKRKIDAVLGLA